MSKKTKTWSVWVDGFEMNSYKLTYTSALLFKIKLENEEAYKDSEIIIEETYKDEE